MDSPRHLLQCVEIVAIKTHRCDTCEHPIFPGDTYLRYLTLRVAGQYRQVSVRKEHLNPGCVDGPPEEETIQDEDTIPLPLAA